MPAPRLGLLALLLLAPFARADEARAINAPLALSPPPNPDCMEQEQFFGELNARLGSAAGTPRVDQAMERLMYSFFEDQRQVLAQVMEGDQEAGQVLARKWAACALSGFSLSDLQVEIMVQGLHDAVQAGNKEAMLLLATLMATGQGVGQDYLKSFDLFTRARDEHLRDQDMKDAYAMKRVRGTSQRDARKRLAAYSFAFEQLFSHLADAHTQDLTSHIGESRFALQLNPCESSGTVNQEATDASFDPVLLQRIVNQAISRLPELGVGCDVQTVATGMPGTLVRYR
ncbi:MAG: SEL1-like repeat protein [Pseudoxanthomonas sp.]